MGALAGCPSQPEEEPPDPTPEPTPSARSAEEFEDVRGGFGPSIDVVEAGADPSGDEPIDDVLADVADDGRRLFFPEGTYLLDGFAGQFEDLTLLGDGASIVPRDRETVETLLEVRGPDNAVIGLTFDYRDVEIPPVIRIAGPDGWRFVDCTFLGMQDTGLDEGGKFCFYPEVTDVDGYGLVRRIGMQDGAAPPGEPDTRGGIWFGPNNEGTIHIDRIWMEGWAENTIYCHNSAGPVVIENSFFRNTNVAGTRVGGRTILRNNTYVKDDDVPRQGWRPEGQGQLMRGIWISGGDSEYGSRGSVLIEDCDFVFVDEQHGGQAIASAYELDGEITIRNCRIRQDFGNAIRVREGTPVILDDVSITGDTDDEAIWIDDEASIENANGVVATRGAVSNRESVISAFETDADPVLPSADPPGGFTNPGG